MKLIVLLILFLKLQLLECRKANITAWDNLRREKRWLIYLNSGAARLQGGISFPVRLYDRVPYRQVNIVYNVYALYNLPLLASDLKPVWLGRRLEEVKYNYEKLKLHENDRLRSILYTILEQHLNQNGRNGRECLKRAICENGQYAENEGILAEIVHEALRPSKHNLHKEYLDAYKAGKSGADCLSGYPSCKKGDSILDQLIFIKE